MKGLLFLVKGKKAKSSTCWIEYSGTCGINYDPEPDPNPDPDPDGPCKINIPPDFCPVVY